MKLLRLLGLALLATAVTMPLGGAATSQEPQAEQSSSPTPTSTTPTSTTPTSTETHTPIEEPEVILTLEASRRIVTFGKRVVLSGRARPETPPPTHSGWEVCWVDRLVELERAASGSNAYRTIASTRTDEDGDFRFRIRPRANGRYHAYLPVTAACQNDEVSPTRSVRVRVAIDTEETPRRIRVRVLPCGDHRGTDVVLRRFTGPRDVFVDIVGREQLNRRCRARFSNPGGNRVQVVWPAQDDDHERGRAWVR